MRPLVKAIFYFLFVFINISCSINVLENFADKKANLVLLQDAKILLNAREYQEALDKINEITGDFANDRKVLYIKASAYAGLGGLDFMALVTALENLSGRLLPMLVQTFHSGTTVAKIDNLILAEDAVEAIGSVSARNDDENLLLAMISLAKVGTILSFYSDNSSPQDSADAGFDPCLDGGGTRTHGGDIADTDIRQLGTGITLAMQALSAAPLSSLSSLVTSISGLCPPATFCSKTDPTLFTGTGIGTDLHTLRSLINEDTMVGLGTNCTGNIGACLCP